MTEIYGITNTGDMVWYRHNGRSDGTLDWDGPNTVGNGWDTFVNVFADGDGVIYGIGQDGALYWYRHDGRGEGNKTFVNMKPIPGTSGWQYFKNVFSGGEGIIYALQDDGSLSWRRHDGRGIGSSDFTGPEPVTGGLQIYKSMFAGGKGIIYGINYVLKDDGALDWYRHDGRGDGTSNIIGPKPVSVNWHLYKAAFPGGAGIIYAIGQDGSLDWYRHDGYGNGLVEMTGPVRQFDSGWGDFKQVVGAPA